MRFLRNFTIISGDSRGKTSVWNAEQASLIKVNSLLLLFLLPSTSPHLFQSFQTHSVDVLCLCMDEVSAQSGLYNAGFDRFVTV
jgi:hypothetical protein